MTRQGRTRSLEDLYEARTHKDLINEFYEHSDFLNFGYWAEGIATAREACEHLMDRLLGALPDAPGAVLDVACGRGATTRSLLRRWSPERVTGIDLSERSLERARINAPGCEFRHMDATELDFADETFDVVLSVEACFHFNTRAKFLAEACRVLKPGGWLVLTDILVARWMEINNPSRTEENYVDSLKEYREIFVGAGFPQPRVQDATRECSTRFYEEMSKHVWRARRAGKIDEDRFQRINKFIGWSMLAQRHYVLVWARKPAA